MTQQRNFVEQYPFVGPAYEGQAVNRAHRYQGDTPYYRWSQDSVDITTSDQAVITTVSEKLDASYGFDSAVIPQAYFRVSTEVEASNGFVVTLQTAGGTSSKLTIEGNGAEMSGTDSVSAMGMTLAGDHSSTEPINALDLSTDSLVAKTTTVANNSSGTAGAILVCATVVPKNIGK